MADRPVYAEKKLGREMERTSALLRISSRLNTSSTYENVLNVICEESAKILNSSVAYLDLYEDSSKAFNLAAVYGISNEHAQSMPHNDSFCDGLAITGAAELSKLIGTDLLTLLNVKCLVSVRLLSENQKIGTLNIAMTDEDRLNGDDYATLIGLADLAVAQIIKAQLWNNNRNQLTAITALYNNAKRLASSLDMNNIAQDVCRTCVETFDSPLAWLGKAEPDGSIRVIGAYPEVEYPYKLNARWDNSPAGKGPTGQAIRLEEPQFINDISKDANFGLWRELELLFGVESIAGFPLISHGKPFGALMVYGKKVNFFKQEKAYYIQAYANQAAAALENAKLFEEAKRRAACLQALREIDIAITNNLDLRVTLNLVSEKVISSLSVEAVDIFLVNEEAKTLTYIAGKGVNDSPSEKLQIYAGQHLLNLCDFDDSFSALSSNSPQDFPPLNKRIAKLKREQGIVCWHLIPLRAKGNVQGLLAVYRCDAFILDAEWKEFLDMIANQAAIAIDNARLLNGLKRSNIELTSAYDATIEGWSRALDLRDKETEGHSERVTDLTLRLASALGLSDIELVNIRRGALLHDIGKMGIPDSILFKAGPLNENEWNVMKKHPVYAYDMLFPIEYLRLALDIPYAHHEKWDGTGYPRGLKGEQIPIAARIFAIIDVWDALSSDRPYRNAWRKERIREYISSLSGVQFDPQIVGLFLKMMDARTQSSAYLVSAF